MTKNDATRDELTEKICRACSQNLPKEEFSKKQWQQKQQRRCTDCIEANREIDPVSKEASIKGGSQSLSSRTSNTKQKKGSKKDKPVFAGNQEGRFKPTTGPPDLRLAEIASNFCAWCGKAEENEKLETCAACKNILFCSRKCQKAAHPEHKLVCDQMKNDRKDSKKEQKAHKKGSLHKKGSFSTSEASGTGIFSLQYSVSGVGVGVGGVSFLFYTGELRDNEQPGQFFATDASREAMRKMLGPHFQLFCQHMKEKVVEGTFKRTEIFTDVDELYPTDVDELYPIDQFLLSCGSLDDIERAKTALPYVLHQLSISGLKPDGSLPNIGDITVRGYNLNALEWAARRGNYSIAEWLATDSRTKVMLTRSDSAPVAWACSENKIELAKMLVKHGADSHTTTEVVFNYKPPSHLASENGQLLALKYLVEECGHDIHECDTFGEDIRASLRRYNNVWVSSAGCVAADEYAKSKGVAGEIIRSRRRRKAEVFKNKANQNSLDDKLAMALKKLKIAGGKKEEYDNDDEEDNDKTLAII
jgi:hypothetical protein